MQARDAIENVTDPDEAESLLRKVKLAEDAARLAQIGGERAQRWAGLKLLAERRYGELLGPAEITPPPCPRLLRSRPAGGTGESMSGTTSPDSSPGTSQIITRAPGVKAGARVVLRHGVKAIRRRPCYKVEIGGGAMPAAG